MMQYNHEKTGETFLPRSNIVPWIIAWAMMPKIGIRTAVIAKPTVINSQSFPEAKPKKGGKIKFPAPKNSEKSAKLVTSIFLVPDIHKLSLRNIVLI